MNDESLPIEEPSVPENEATLPAETEAAQTADGALTEGTIYEDLSGSNIEETIAGTLISLEDLERVGSDVVHADLFGSFLVCGTLIGLALLRNIHGTKYCCFVIWVRIGPLLWYRCDYDKFHYIGFLSLGKKLVGKEKRYVSYCSCIRCNRCSDYCF